MQQLSLSAKVSAMCISFCFSFFLPNFGRSSALFVHTVYNYPLPWQTFFAISFCFSFFLPNLRRSSALFVHIHTIATEQTTPFFTISSSYLIPIYYCTIVLLRIIYKILQSPCVRKKAKRDFFLQKTQNRERHY